MLNVKIGTKLFGGFFAVLALLVAIWLVSWYSFGQKTIMSGEVDTSNTLSNRGLSIQRDVFDAMLSLKEMIITRKKEESDEVQRKILQIKEKHKEDTSLMVEAEAKQRWDKVMVNLDRLTTEDANYWATEIKRKDAGENRTALAKQAQDSIIILQAGVNMSTKERHAVMLDDKAVVQIWRVDLEVQIAMIALLLREASLLSLQYELALEDAERKQLSADIERKCNEMKTEIDTVAGLLVSPDNQERLAALKEIMDQWYGSIVLTIQLENELAQVNADCMNIADDINEDISYCVKNFFDPRAAAAKKEAEIFDTNVERILAVVSLCAIIFGVFISYVLTRNITGGIARAVYAIKLIADDGNLTFEIPPGDLSSRDEIGDLAKAFAALMKQFQNVEHLAKELADGNYDVITHVRGDQDTMNIYLNKMLDQVNSAMHEINEDVKQVATSSGEVSNAAANLSSGSQEAAASLEQITASMSEISSQTKTNAESAGQARDLANQTSHAAAEGQAAMKDMTTAMERITQNSNEIQRVIRVIDDIAFQTNLLALNAAVEAARAGQHGKGFAVVAEEVRNLASRSATAAKETSELIEKSGHEIEKGGEVAAHTASVLDTIVEQIKQTTDLVANIAVASNEQAQGVNQVSIGLHQIDSVTQQNTAASEESASAANEMSTMAANLQELVAQFKLRA